MQTRPIPNTFDAPATRGATALASGVLLAIAVSSLIVAGFATTRPRSDRLAVVFPPWWSAERSLAAAADIAPVSGVGALPFIIAISARDPASRGRLFGAGAWAVLDGARFSFCLSR